MNWSEGFIARAEACGCKGLVLTLDTSLLGWRIRDLNNAYLPFLEGKGIAQYVSDPVFQKMLDNYDPPQTKKRITIDSINTLFSLAKAYPGSTFSNLFSPRPLKAVRQFIDIYSRTNLTWDDISRLREWTKMPIILKGIMHPEDAKKAYDIGIRWARCFQSRWTSSRWCDIQP